MIYKLYNGLRKKLSVSLIGLVTYAGLNNSLNAAGPDPSTECVLPNVTCVSPNSSTWVNDVQNALNNSRNVYLTDMNLDTEDTFIFPLPNTPEITLSITNQKIYGEGMFNTVVKRDGSIGTGIFKILGNGVIIKDLTIKDAENGIYITGSNYDNIELNNINGNNFSSQYVVWDKSDLSGNSSPNIMVKNSIFDGGKLVIHFNDLGDPSNVGPNTKYVGLEGLTVRNIRDNGNGLVIDAPLDRTNMVYLGNNDINNSTMEGSDNNWTEDFLLRSQSPSNMIEWDITGGGRNPNGYTLANPPPGMEPIGFNNIEADPLLSAHGFPKPGSPAIRPDGTIAGALPPFGDSDGDKDVDLNDYAKLQIVYRGSGIPGNLLKVAPFDEDGDMDIDISDLETIVFAITGPR